MQIEWRELALWCFCSFFLGMCVGPVFFLDADVLRWVSICGAALGATVAVGGFLMNSATYRLQAKAADQQEFRRMWKLFRMGQLVCVDLHLAIADAEQLLKTMSDKADVTFEELKVLSFDLHGRNIDIGDDPHTFAVVDDVWKMNAAVREELSDPKNAKLPIPEAAAVLLHSRIEAMEDAREDVNGTYLESMKPYFVSRGWMMERDKDGDYDIKNKEEHTANYPITMP